MEPEIIALPFASIDSYESSKMGMDSASPVDKAWVGALDQFYAVGYLARERFNGNAGLSQLKLDRAIPKAMAAVWAASVELKLGNQFEAAVAVLLPPGEFENAPRLRSAIEVSLKNFQTPTGTLNVTLTDWDCKPEGGGIYMMHTLEMQQEELKQKTLAVIMLGFCNTSVLVATRGVVTKRITSDLGFIKLLDRVMKKTSGLDINKLAAALATAGNPPDFKALIPVLRSTSDAARKEELIKLKSAITTSRSEYVLSLSSWLNEVLPKGIDEAILCGGTADYLRPELSDYFKSTSVVWHGKLPPEFQQHPLSHRMCDAFGVYEFLKTLVWERVSKEAALREKALSNLSSSQEVLTSDALQKLAFQSVYALCSHARFLCATFGLDPAAFGLSVSGVTRSSFPQVQIISQGLTPSVELANPISTAVHETDVDDGVDDAEESVDTELDDFNEDAVEGFSFYASSANLRFNAAGL